MAKPITVMLSVRCAWLLLIPLAIEGLGLAVAYLGAWGASWLIRRLMVVEGGKR